MHRYGTTCHRFESPPMYVDIDSSKYDVINRLSDLIFPARDKYYIKSIEKTFTLNLQLFYYKNSD